MTLFDSFKYRLETHLKNTNRTLGTIAREIGVSEAGLRHVMSGKTKTTSLNMIEKIAINENLDINWLLALDNPDKIFLDQKQTQENAIKMSRILSYLTGVIVRSHMDERRLDDLKVLTMKEDAYWQAVAVHFFDLLENPPTPLTVPPAHHQQMSNRFKAGHMQHTAIGQSGVMGGDDVNPADQDRQGEADSQALSKSVRPSKSGITSE